MAVTVAFRTLGCKQNQFDTESLRLRLQDQGWQSVPLTNHPDWIVLNTCAVTGRALAKARGEISRLRRIHPATRIIALGCGAACDPQNFAGADYINSLPLVLGAAGTHPGCNPAPPHGVLPAGRSRALLRVQSGCDQSCAFCIVPSLRGRSRSVPIDQCREALNQLVAQGAPEIVLTGTNIGAWGKDLPEQPHLGALLAGLLADVAPARLRLSSLEPHLVEPEFLDRCLEQPRLCRHFHFALQSGSPAVLERMGRGDFPAALIARLRQIARAHPEVCLGADFIVGFPGETPRDFEQTLELARSVPLSYLHVFPFSERPGTPAARQPGAIPVAERLLRARELRKLGADLKNAFTARNAYSPADVIYLNASRSGPRVGLTSNYLRVMG